ncbi:TetR/AcrR family transcriptional regulator [Lysinibacillus alkalisoli]|uniref:TetR/AcrR family transcriptional regulator n=1 Tax=Lysinibacillus alkalisoli TaxID=1911548 RepID=UPI00166C9AA7|nr:TetR/AcrR family transcriptional regulator [Lysinibacillus alkalisoli]
MKVGTIVTSLKQSIIDASLSLFKEHGYNGVTVNQIVQHAGTSKGGFYHHFTSKDELLYEIHDVFISYVLKNAKTAYHDYHTPITRLVAILRTFTEVFHTYQAHIIVFYEESQSLLGDERTLIKAKRDEYRKLLQRVIEEGQTCGDFRKVLPPIIVTMSITGMINWTYKWYKQDGTLTMQQITAIFIDMILRGIVTKQGEQEASLYFLHEPEL